MEIKSKHFLRFENRRFIADTEPSQNGNFASWPAYADTWKSTEADTGKPPLNAELSSITNGLR
jgi:hypothetical protein